MRVHSSATRGLIPLLGAFALVSCTGSVPAPTAVIAGSAQTVNTGDFVQLDGSGSSDPQNRAITFSWSFAKRPLGSQVSLIDASSPRASFKADAPGEFMVELTVSNSLLVSAPAQMTVTVADCGAHAPTVNATATPSTTKPTGVVQLTATASDADNACGLTQTLTVRWTLDSRPQGSTALPTSNTLAITSFTPDKPGNYEFNVVATDSTGRSSQPATVIVTATTCSEDLPGVGSISISSGGARVMGTAISLQANNVTDTNCLSTGSPQLQWSLTVPGGSRAALDNVFGNTPTFLPDVPGAYLVSVSARNSEGKTSDAVFLTLNVVACSPAPPQRPTILGIAATQADPEVGPLLGTSANPIPHVGTTVTLIPDGVVAAYCGAIPTTPLTYSWTVTQRPAGSQAQLDSSVASSPTFTPDKVGHYQFAAVAKDAFGNSTASKTFDFDTSACGANPLTVTVTRGDGSAVPANFLTNTPEALLASANAVENDPAACPPRFAVNVASATFSFMQLFGPATATISSPSLGSATATFTAAEVGAYVVEVAASAGGHTGSKLVTQTGFLNPVPPAITAPAFATVGTSVTATTPARANMAYAWTVNGAPVTSGIVAGKSTATAAATADLTFVVIESSTAVTSSATSASALVRAAPVPATPLVSAPTIATDGMPYTASATARTGMTYVWSVGTGGAITSPGGASGVLSGGGTQTSITFTGSPAQSPLHIMLTEVNQAGDAASGFTDVIIIARANAPTVSLAAAFVTTGGTITSTVTGRAAAPFACTVTGGSSVGAGSGTLDLIGAASFTITAGAPGILQVSCTQQDAAGSASPSGTATATVAPTATPPNISAPQAVTASQSYVAFISARSGMTYQWTLDSGFIESVGGSAGELSADGRTSSIRFDAGPVGTIHLSVKETNQAGDSTATSTTTIAVVSQSLSPVITAPSNVTATRSYIATVPARAGFTYSWEVGNGAPDPTADTTHDPVGVNVFHFKPGVAGANGSTATMTLSVTETNAAGDSSASSTFAATVFPNPIAPTITITNALNAVLASNAGVTAGEALLATIAAQASITFQWTATNSTLASQAGGTTFNFTGTNNDAAGNALTLSLTVVASNSLHDTATGTATLQVFPRPVAPTIVITDAFTSVLPNGADLTAGDALLGTITAQPGITFAWTGTNSNPLTQAGGTTFNFTGTNADPNGNSVVATVTVVASNAIGFTATSATRTLDVFPRPVAPTIVITDALGGTLADGADVTGGDALQGTITAQPGITFEWTGTNTTPLTQTDGTTLNFVGTNSDPGGMAVVATLVVTATNAIGAMATSGTRALDVFPVPVAPSIIITDAHSTILGNGANVTASDALVGTISAQAGITFAWTGTNTNPLGQAGGTTFNFTGTNADAAGSSVVATLKVVASNAIGASATSLTRSLDVFPLPDDATIALATGGGTPVASGADVTAGSFQATTNTQKSTITYQWTITPAGNRANVTGAATTNVHFDALANADNTDATVNVTITVENAIGRMKTTPATLVVHPAPQTPTIHIVGPDGNDNAVTQGATGVRAQVDARDHFHYVWTYAFASAAGISAGTLTNPNGTAGDLTADGLHNFVLLTVPADATHIRLSSTELNDLDVASAVAKLQATAVPAPAITSFTASPSTILFNDSSTLSATYTGSSGAGTCGAPDSACVDHGRGSISSGGTVSTGSLADTTTFTLSVVNPAGTSTSAQATVTVNAWVSLNNTPGQVTAGSPDTSTVDPTALAIDATATSTPKAYLASVSDGILSSATGEAPWTTVSGATAGTSTVAVAHTLKGTPAVAGLSVWATGACSGEVWQSTDGTTFSAITGTINGLPATDCTAGHSGVDLKVDPSDGTGQTVWVAFQGAGIFVTTDDGASWTSDTPPSVDVSALAIYEDGTVFAGTSTGTVWFKTPGGSWTELTDPTGTVEPASVASLTVWKQPSNTHILLLKGGSDGVLVGGTVDLVTAAVNVTVEATPGGSTDRVSTTYAPGTEMTVYVVTGNRLFRSTDQGATSDKDLRLNQSEAGVYHSIVVHPANQQRLYSIGTPGVFRLDLP